MGQDGDEVPPGQLARVELSELLGVVQEVACIVSLEETSAIAGFRLGHVSCLIYCTVSQTLCVVMDTKHQSLFGSPGEPFLDVFVLPLIFQE